MVSENLIQEILKSGSTKIESLKLNNGNIIDVYSGDEYIVTLTQGHLIVTLKTFAQGKTVPDLKAEKAATDFAKKIKDLIEK